jgi:flagellar protein FlaI
LLTIEDTQEIRLHHDNWLPAVTRESVSEETDVDMYDLLRSALRHRPEYIIVGEVRGREAMTLFQAMNTGHTTYSTMHADSIQTVINRLENDPINVSRSLIQMLDILSVQQLSRIDGERVRRTKTISEIVGISQRSGDLEYSDVFSWDPSDDSFEGHGANSHLIQEIQKDQGWTSEEIRREFQNRKNVLRYAQRQSITDYQNFTALVNEYYADSNVVLDRIEDEVGDVLAAAD